MFGQKKKRLISSGLDFKHALYNFIRKTNTNYWTITRSRSMLTGRDADLLSACSLKFGCNAWQSLMISALRAMKPAGYDVTDIQHPVTSVTFASSAQRLFSSALATPMLNQTHQTLIDISNYIPNSITYFLPRLCSAFQPPKIILCRFAQPNKRATYFTGFLSRYIG